MEGGGRQKRGSRPGADGSGDGGEAQNPPENAGSAWKLGNAGKRVFPQSPADPSVLAS